MAITSAKWEQTMTGEKFIRAVIDGNECQVPDDMGNALRQEIALWELAGNIIEPIVPPVINNDALDTAALNALLVEPGSITRALALVLFAEINKLRLKTGDPVYTLAQFKTALKAQMR